jgi:hypothetical protein
MIMITLFKCKFFITVEHNHAPLNYYYTFFFNCLLLVNRGYKTVHPSRKYATLTMEPRFCVFDMS